MTRNQSVGRYGEKHVERQLIDRGYRICERNWRTHGGEVDIIALDPYGTLAFIEMKTRTSRACGDPVEAITPAKLARMRRLAGCYLFEHPHHGPIRIDVASVLLSREGAPHVNYLAGV